MRYRALGPITVEVDGTDARLGGMRQRLVLAVLLSRVNHVVSQDGLIDSVWAGEPPEAARATLQSYIYHLRIAIGSDSILRRGDGYVIEADATTFDVADFENRVADGRSLLATDPAAARDRLLRGLGLWFGTAYGGVDLPELDAEIHRLVEVRINAIETRIEADLALGRSAELVGELGSLVREHPLRERFWAQLMLALYRSGRQAEALRTYQKARDRLVGDLGLEPGSELQQLEERILGQDAALLVPRRPDRNRPSHPGEPETVRGYEMREVVGVGYFGKVHRAFQPSIGREVALKVIDPRFANDAQFITRFERDAQLVAGLEHPHILPLFDYWRDPSGAYLAMPLMRGGSLEQSLRGGGWSLEPALRLLDQVGSALAHAHRRGVVHGNVKTGNVLLDEEGNAYLSDFGLVRRATGGAIPSGGESPVESGEGVTIRSDIFGLGSLTYELLTGISFSESEANSDLAEARPDTPPALAATVGRATAIDPAQRFGKVEELLRAIRRAIGADVVATPDDVAEEAGSTRNPYKGLRAFTEGDAADFHGRATLVDDLLQRVSSHRLVTVVGPSGSGKSSVVRAGLIPALRAGALPGSRHWLVTDMFPGSYPFEELEAALIRVAVQAPSGLLEELSQPNGLVRVTKGILPGDDSTLLIVIDQFEELFSTVRSEETRRRFLDSLISAAHDERSRIRLVMTVRADFLDRPLGYADFAEAIADGIVTVGPPTREGLAQAVADPARAVGLEPEPGLVSRIISDVEGQPGALPLLQHALSELFSRREGSTLTIAGYEATGGVAGALGRRAEELYAGLIPAGRAAARKVFLRLVTVDEMGTITRRRARQSELTTLAVDRSDLDSLLNAFARFRLLTFDRDPVTRGPTVEVAHEALLTEWPRLRGWIDEARESLVLARRVGESAREWAQSLEDPSYLLRGSRLEDLEGWATHAAVVLTADEARYISASLEQRRAELDSARSRRRRTVAALAFGLLLVSALAIVALLQRGAAEREALEARVRELAAASIGQLDYNRELALLIAVEAFDMSTQGGVGANTEAVSAMAQAISDWRLISRFPAGPDLHPAASRDGSLIAVQSKTSPADVDLFRADGSLAGTLQGPSGTSVSAWQVAFGTSGDTVAVTYALIENVDVFRSVSDGVSDLRVFDLRNGSVVLDLDTEHGWRFVSYGPGDEQLALSFDREVRIVDAADGTEVSAFVGSSRAGQPQFLDSDEILVPIEGSGFAIISVADGSVLDRLEVAQLNPFITATNELRTHVAFRAGEHLRVLEVATGRTVFDLRAPSVQSVALDPDASRLAHSGFDSLITVQALGEGETEVKLTGTLENVLSLAFIGEWGLLSYGEDALLWDVTPAGVSELGGVRLLEPQWGFQVSSDEGWLAYFVSTNNGGPIGDPVDGLRMIDLKTGEETAISHGEWNSVTAGYRQLSADFEMLGSLTLEGVSSMRGLPGWELLREFDECRSPIAVTPDKGRVVLSGWGCADRVAPESARSSVIDLETGAEILSLPYQSLWSAQFNPEGVFAGGRFLAAADLDSVGVWDTTDGTLRGTLDGSDRDDFGVLMIVNFDPTGRYLVGGTTGGTVWVADVERVLNGEHMLDALVFDRQAHTGAAPAPAINGHGVVATAGFDGMVRLWDLHSGALIFEFEADLGIPVVRFSPDGTELLYPDGLSIRRMPVDPHRLRAIAGELLTRDFLPGECSRYAAGERCQGS